MRTHRLLGPAATTSKNDRHDECRCTCVDVDGRSTGEVDDLGTTDVELADPATAPYPVGNREVDEGGPCCSEDDPRTELHAIGKCTGDEAHGQACEHRLEDHVDHDRECVALSGWRKRGFKPEVVGEATDEVARRGAVRHRVAVDRPQNADDEQRAHDHHEHVEN